MVKIMFFIIAVVYPLFNTQANPVDIIDSSLIVDSIEIKKNGAYSGHIDSPETEASCKEFVFNKEEALIFFKTAKRVTPYMYSGYLSESNCYVSGLLTLRNGRQGKWRIDRQRRGEIFFDIDDSLYYYCVKCENKLFVKACDDDACLSIDES